MEWACSDKFFARAQPQNFEISSKFPRLQGIPHLHDESNRTKNRLWKIIKMTYVLIKILQVKQCVLICADISENDTSSSKTLRRKFSSNDNFVEMSLRQIRHLVENLPCFRICEKSPCNVKKRKKKKQHCRLSSF